MSVYLLRTSSWFCRELYNIGLIILDRRTMNTQNITVLYVMNKEENARNFQKTGVFFGA
jgi:hypothetical protein